MAASQSTTPESLLKTVFGYDTFRPLQREVIANVLHKKDSLAIMPTGGGKSLCYQIPALLFSGLTVVVSPLISLMKDQVEQLHALGVPALFLNSSLAFDEYQRNMQRVRNKEIKLLYVAPETLLTPRLLNLLQEVPPDCLTIDEAHCISEWGHDFRPEYRQLVEVRQRFPKAVCLALTATATPRVRDDIKNSLGFAASNEFIASFDRPNLLIEVTPKDDPASQTLQFLQRYPNQSGIIYCFSRKQVDDLTTFLKARGYQALPYHAGLEDEERRLNQELFIRDDVQIIVATIAFGMGINKPNVRFVIHYDLPKSIESYYQEIGRAGRDGLTSHCLLLYSYGDLQKLRYFIDQKEGSERQAALLHLNALVRYAESESCRRGPLLSYFGETYTEENCSMCDRCLNGETEQVDLTIPAQKFLSCVRRTGERFGAGHVADVLLGADNEKVQKFNHQSLSTYGIGQELTRKQWLHLARQLVAKHYLVEDDIYRGLKLTPKAYALFQGKEEFWGVIQTEKAKVARKAGRASEAYDPLLFEILRKSRKELADTAEVPPYIIFSDRTLVEMATYFPTNAAALSQINGVGEVKLERYGQLFLDLIVQFLQEHPRKDIPSLSTSKGTLSTQIHKPRYVEVGEAFQAGTPIAELAQQFSVKPETILENLARYVQDGHALRDEADILALLTLPPDQNAAAFSAFETHGAERLKPVFEALGETVNYDDLKVLRILFLSRQNAQAA